MRDGALLQVARPGLRSIIGACIGNLIEWFDWTTYATFSLYFAKTFFPRGDRTAPARPRRSPEKS